MEANKNIILTFLEGKEHGLPDWLIEDLSLLEDPVPIQLMKAANLVGYRVISDAYYALSYVEIMNNQVPQRQLIHEAHVAELVYNTLQTMRVRSRAALRVLRPVMSAFIEVAVPPESFPELAASCYTILPVVIADEATLLFDSTVQKKSSLDIDFDADFFSPDLKDAVLTAIREECSLPWEGFMDPGRINKHRWKAYADQELMRAMRLVLREGLLDYHGAAIIPVAPGAQSDDPRGAPAQSSPAAEAKDEKLETPSRDGSTKVRSAGWTQKRVNQAIWQYISARTQAFDNYANAIDTAHVKVRSQLIKKARKIFGRNPISQALQCPPAMVSRSPAWQHIKSELKLSSKKRPGHIGLDIALEQKSQEGYDPIPEIDERLDRESELQKIIDEQTADESDYIDREKL